MTSPPPEKRQKTEATVVNALRRLAGKAEGKESKGVAQLMTAVSAVSTAGMEAHASVVIKAELTSHLASLTFPGQEVITGLVELADVLSSDFMREVMEAIDERLHSADPEGRLACWCFVDALVRSVGDPYLHPISQRLPEWVPDTMVSTNDTVGHYASMLESWAKQNVFTNTVLQQVEEAVRKAAEAEGAPRPNKAGPPPVPPMLRKAVLPPLAEVSRKVIFENPTHPVRRCIDRMYAPTPWTCEVTAQRFATQEALQRHRQRREERLGAREESRVYVRAFYCSPEIWCDPEQGPRVRVVALAEELAAEERRGEEQGEDTAETIVELAEDDINEYKCNVCDEELERKMRDEGYFYLENARSVDGNVYHSSCYELWRKQKTS